MTTILILLAAWVLRLGWIRHQRGLVIEMLAIQNEQLKSVNAMLLRRCKTPDADVSDFADSEAAIAFAIRCGYIGAITSQNVKEDVTRRADALRSALEYYREHVAGRVASANH